MLPSPLHPAVVHFPIVLAILLPIVAVVALVLMARGRSSRAVWLVPLVFSAAMAAAAFVALETGQNEEDRVEKVVSERVIGAHEEAAEQFLIFSGILFLITAAGLMRGNVGRSARVLGTVGAFAALFLGVRVGKAGGELVYKHGAAAAYAANAGGTAVTRETVPAGGTQNDAAAQPEGGRGGDHDDDD